MEYAAGIRFTDVAHAVAGIAEPPTPMSSCAPSTASSPASSTETRGRTRNERAFCMVLAAGRAEVANDTDQADEAQASSSPRTPPLSRPLGRICSPLGPVARRCAGLEARFRVSLVRGCRAAAAQVPKSAATSGHAP